MNMPLTDEELEYIRTQWVRESSERAKTLHPKAVLAMDELARRRAAEKWLKENPGLSTFEIVQESQLGLAKDAVVEAACEYMIDHTIEDSEILWDNLDRAVAALRRLQGGKT